LIGLVSLLLKSFSQREGGVGVGEERGGDQERCGSKTVCRRGERGEQKDTHSGNDERTRAALPGFTLYL
jgi:hypothetical protein